MKDIMEYKKISLEFRRYASNVLNTEYNNYNAPLYRFKNYIDTQPIIKKIIEKATNNVDADYKDYFLMEKNGWSNINIPIDEKEHIKVMYDFMTYIVDNKLDVQGIALKFYCESRKLTDILRNFLSRSFKPLIEYIVDELSKEIMLLEESNLGIRIDGNSGNINLATNNSIINATNNSNNVKEIIDLANRIKEILSNEQIEKEYKENIIDDIDIITEQVENSIQKPTRVKKALENIKKFFTGPQGVSLGTVALNNINEFITAIQELIN